MNNMEVGVIIEQGPQDWQIFQQNKTASADIRLSGRWLTDKSYQHAQVIVRLMVEDWLQPVNLQLDWQSAKTSPDGSWSAVLKAVPAGGLYRLETALQLDGGAVEWALRGDQRHHLGVGDIWVIAGQSNAAGYGKTPCFDPPELGIHLFHSCGEWRLASHPFSDSTRTMYTANRENANGSHSPFLCFARCLKRNLHYPIGIIPTALGGSNMSQWVRGEDGRLFENMLSYLRDAGSSCRGMVWYQGESDTSPELCQCYLRKFRQMVKDFRSAMKNREIPIITAQLNRYIGEPYQRPVHHGWEVMREIQRQIARKVKGVAIVSTLDLALSDGIHNDSKGNLVIGERMADAALGFVYGRNIKWRCPEIHQATSRGRQAVDLLFECVDLRLHFENNIPEQIPFAVRDQTGIVEITSWRFTGKNRMRLELARSLQGSASVTGAPNACPPSVVPFDICGYRPILGFTVPVE